MIRDEITLGEIGKSFSWASHTSSVAPGMPRRHRVITSLDIVTLSVASFAEDITSLVNAFQNGREDFRKALKTFFWLESLFLFFLPGDVGAKRINVFVVAIAYLYDIRLYFEVTIQIYGVFLAQNRVIRTKFQVESTISCREFFEK